MKKKIIIIVSVIVVLAIGLSLANYFTSYNRIVKGADKAKFTYKGDDYDIELDDTLKKCLTEGKKKSYKGEIPNKEYEMVYKIEGKATLYVYPIDFENMVIRYEPEHGIARNYKKTHKGDFDRILETLYANTGVPIFNEVAVYF